MSSENFDFDKLNTNYLKETPNWFSNSNKKMRFLDDSFNIFKSESISDKRITKVKNMITPWEIKRLLILDKKTENWINSNRKVIESIINGSSNKKLIISGPCSIHNAKQAIEYAKFIKKMRVLYSDKMEIVMRVYMTKPRTNLGWKGYVYDPRLDGSNDIELGLKLSREIMLKIVQMGVPCAMEHVDTIIPQYFDDLVSWAAIGARTTESQIHRELSSGISTPIGFKNGTNGDVDIAINAIIASKNPHNFIGCDLKGYICSIETKGNPFCHIILRGSKSGPNYNCYNVKKVIESCKSKNITNGIIIDCSHGNCEKNFKNQIPVACDVLKQMTHNRNLVGIMLESNISEGKQQIGKLEDIKYDVSITDGCLHLEDTKKLFDLYHKCL